MALNALTERQKKTMTLKSSKENDEDVIDTLEHALLGMELFQESLCKADAIRIRMADMERGHSRNVCGA
jgi:hypothetical protein